MKIDCPHVSFKIFMLTTVFYFSLISSFVHAQGFSETTPLNTAAGNHSANLLGDGRVIIIGLDVEIYDPVTKAWTTKTPMNTPRAFHTATLLNNGKILVAGGRNTDVVNSCELYDIVNDAWTTVGSLIEARSEPQATLLTNGKVLVTAGDGIGGTLASAELFDPDTNSWSSAGSMTAKRSRHRQVRLDNGEVLVAGGREFGAPTGHPTLSSVEIYNPANNSWRAGATMSEAHYSSAMIKLADGNVLMATGGKTVEGSCCGVEDHGGSEIYNPNTDSWSSTGQLSTPRRSSSVSILCDGRVLVSGGFEGSDFDSPVTASAEIYDPKLGSWREVGPMLQARTRHSSTLLNDCTILLAGGGSNSGGTLNSAVLYDPKPEDELCVPVKTSNGKVALICL